jgi:hypothetical protein
MSMIGGLTIAFAILQRFGVKGDGNEQTFNPLKLPKVEHDELVNRAGQLVGFVVGVIVLALLAYLPSRLENFLPNTIILRLPAVEAVLGWIAASIIVSLVLNLILLVRGRWTLFARLVNIASNLFSMIIIGWILNSPSPLVAAGELGREVVEIAEMGVRIGLVVALVVLVIDTGVILYGLLKRHVLAPPVKDLTV